MDTNRSSHRNDKTGLNKNFGKLIISFILIAIILGVSLVLYEAKAQTENSSKGNVIIMHFHPHLNITMDGKPIIIPAQIGINSSLWKDHSLDKYGMQSMNMRMPGMAPLHTHDASGVIHVESNDKNRNYTLGQFLDIWGGLDLNDKTVKMTVNGKSVSDFRNHILRDKEQIILDIEK